MSDKNFSRLVLAALALALAVIMLGGYVRLSDAGLGCPDWPGCYGHMIVPGELGDVARANQAYPDRPFESDKAWKEMAHRYLAGILGLLVLLMTLLAFRRSRQRGLVGMIAVLIILQALLGMWTVTLLLKPLVVVLHLLGGMSIAALLWLLWLQLQVTAEPGGLQRYRLLAAGALAVLALQLVLGGWTSSNYAATACPDFPACQDSYWPEADYSEAFVLWRGLGRDYEGGVLETPARVAIHFTHRLGAVAVTMIIAILVAVAWRRGKTLDRAALAMTALLVLLQLALGAGLVKLGFPLAVAVAHNGVATMLLLAVVLVNYLAFARPAAIS